MENNKSLDEDFIVKNPKTANQWLCSPEKRKQRIKDPISSPPPSSSSTDRQTCPVCFIKISDLNSHLKECCQSKFSRQNKSNETVSVEFKCAVCQKDLRAMNSQRRLQHVDRCLEKETLTREKIKTSSSNNLSVFLCPICRTQFSSLESRSLHLKNKCGKKSSGETLMTALKMEDRHMAERIAIGLPIMENKLKAATKKRSYKPKISNPKNFSDAELQMALALSASLHQTENIDPISDLINQPIQKKSKIVKKNKNPKMVPRILLQTCEGRQRLLQDRIANLLAFSNEFSTSNSNPFFVLPEKFSSGDQGRLWNLGAEEFTTFNEFYVEELSNNIEANCVRMGSKLKRLSQIAGRINDTQINSLSENSNFEKMIDGFDSPIPFYNETLQVESKTFTTPFSSSQRGAAGESNYEPNEMSNIFESGGFCSQINKLGSQNKIGNSEEEISVSGSNSKVEPNARLITDLHKLVNETNFSDGSILLSDQSIFAVHLVLLSTRCPTLCQELTSSACNLVDWSNVQPIVALLFFQFIYGGKFGNEYNFKCHCDDLINLAEKYNVLDLKAFLNAKATLPSSDYINEEEEEHVTHVDLENTLIEIIGHIWEESGQEKRSKNVKNLSPSKKSFDFDFESDFLEEELSFPSPKTNLSSADDEEQLKEGNIDLQFTKLKQRNDDSETQMESEERKVNEKSNLNVEVSTLARIECDLLNSSSTKIEEKVNFSVPDIDCVLDKHNSNSKTINLSSNSVKLIMESPIHFENVDCGRLNQTPVTSSSSSSGPRKIFDKLSSFRKKRLSCGNFKKVSFEEKIADEEEKIADDKEKIVDDKEKIADEEEKGIFQESMIFNNINVDTRNSLIKNNIHINALSPNIFDSSEESDQELEFSVEESSSAKNANSFRRKSDNVVVILEDSPLIMSSGSCRETESKEYTNIGKQFEIEQDILKVTQLGVEARNCDSSKIVSVNEIGDERLLMEPVSGAKDVSPKKYSIGSSDQLPDLERSLIRADIIEIQDSSPEALPILERIRKTLSKVSSPVKKRPRSNLVSPLKRVPSESSSSSQQTSLVSRLNKRSSQYVSPQKVSVQQASQPKKSPVLNKQTKKAVIIVSSQTRLDYDSSPDAFVLPVKKKLEVKTKTSSSSSSSRTTSKTVLSSQSQLPSASPCTPMPDYRSMVTPELKGALKKVGVKGLPRKKAVAILTHIYETTHPVIESGVDAQHISQVELESNQIQNATTSSLLSSQQPNKNKNREKRVPSPDFEEDDSSSSGDSQSSFLNSNFGPILEESVLFFQRKNSKEIAEEELNEDEISQESNGCLFDIETQLKNFLRSDSEIHEAILLYQPIPIEEIRKKLKLAGINISQSSLMDFFDGQCITFTLPRSEKGEEKRRNKRFRKRIKNIQN